MSEFTLQPDGQPGVAKAPYVTPPGSNTEGPEMIIFFCSMPAASIHRKDGKKLAFVFGYHETAIQEDIKFLDAEIADGNMYFKRASKEEMLTYRQRIDPRKAMEAEVRANLEPALRVEIEAQIRAELAGGVSDEDKIAGVDPMAKLAALKTSTAVIADVPTNPARINPVSSASIQGADSNSK